MSNKRGRGRPTKMTPDVIGKLEDAFSNGFPDDEACFYAGINPDTLYEYQKRHPKFTERKEGLKRTLNMLARKTVAKSLSNSQDAWRWLEKKDASFKPTQRIEHEGSVVMTEEPLTPDEAAALKLVRDARRKKIQANIKSMT